MADARRRRILGRVGVDRYPARFADRLALVTGANLGGIGGAVALRLAAEGAMLGLLSHQPLDDLLEAVAPFKNHAFGMQADVRDARQIEQFVAEATRRFGPVQVLVNNAGIGSTGPFEQTSPQDWADVLDVNLSGVIRMTQAALPHMTQGRAAIVNVASALALGGACGYAAYSASKGGVIALTRALAAELAPRQVRVVAVAPALVKTPMVERHFNLLSPQAWARTRAAQPLGIGKPEDVAAAVAFLASDEARWINGAVLPLGWTPTFDLPQPECEPLPRLAAAG